MADTTSPPVAARALPSELAALAALVLGLVTCSVLLDPALAVGIVVLAYPGAWIMNFMVWVIIWFQTALMGDVLGRHFFVFKALLWLSETIRRFYEAAVRGLWYTITSPLRSRTS